MMKISKIVLYNIGPYNDQNVFDLTLDKHKNIVLIGGKNGAGKTTFFNSIKTCLYGCLVWGFEAVCKEYYEIIGKLITSRTQYDDSIRAYIEIELLFDNGKQRNFYTLHREWNSNRKTIREDFTVKKDQRLLDSSEQYDFINYLLSIIPPDMFNFYFFDGESISDFFLGNNGGKNFKNAFLKLYGLDTISLMVENFERCAKKNYGEYSSLEVYNAAKSRVQKIEEQLNELKKDKLSISSEVDLMQMQIAALQNDYNKSGGVTISEWKELNASLQKEEALREDMNRWLKDVANHYLPFTIVKKQLLKLQSELEHERDSKRAMILKESISTTAFKEKLAIYLHNNGGSEANVESLISFICNEAIGSRNGQILFDFSDAQISRLYGQIYDKLNFDESKVSVTLKQLTNSLNKSKRIREKLAASSIDGFEEFSKQKEILEKNIAALLVKSERTSQAMQIYESELDSAKSDYEKAKDAYEKLLKNKSISDISSRAAGAYLILEEKLIRKQSKLVQREFLKCFKSIINKENFIDGIVIDNNINVIPYKLIDVSFLQIENYLKANGKTGFLSLFDSTYLTDIRNLRIGKFDSIKLPSPITAPFSQGERQVYIMSIYLALLKTSHRDIPFFIDTPFARIDSNHRAKIVKEFFNVIDNQMFILSTDEEIVGEYEKLIDAKVSDKFTLEASTYGKTHVKHGTYFEVK